MEKIEMITENKPKNKFCSKMAGNCGVLFIALAVLLLIGCGAKDDSPVDHSFDTGTKTAETAASDKNTAETAASDKNIAETATSGTTDSEIITTDAEDSGTITEAAGDIKELIGLSIPTPVGEITYPEEESEKVTIECVSANGRLSYRFFSEVQGEKILLFEFFFGSEGVGYQIGSAPDNTGNMQKIWLDISTIDPRDAWTPDEISRINLQQEYVNELLNQIYSLSGFTTGE